MYKLVRDREATAHQPSLASLGEFPRLHDFFHELERYLADRIGVSVA